MRKDAVCHVLTKNNKIRLHSKFNWNSYVTLFVYMEVCALKSNTTDTQAELTVGYNEHLLEIASILDSWHVPLAAKSLTSKAD